MEERFSYRLDTLGGVLPQLGSQQVTDGVGRVGVRLCRTAVQLDEVPRVLPLEALPQELSEEIVVAEGRLTEFIECGHEQVAVLKFIQSGGRIVPARHSAAQ